MFPLKDICGLYSHKKGGKEKSKKDVSSSNNLQHEMWKCVSFHTFQWQREYFLSFSLGCCVVLWHMLTKVHFYIQFPLYYVKKTNYITVLIFPDRFSHTIYSKMQFLWEVMAFRCSWGLWLCSQQGVSCTLKFLGDVHSAPSASLAKPQEYQPAVSSLILSPSFLPSTSRPPSFPCCVLCSWQCVMLWLFNSNMDMQLLFCFLLLV